MNENQNQYQRIAQAIDYINENFQAQPSLNEIAAKVNLSPFHFQRMFTDWAGISPKKFIQFISVEYAKKLLSEQQFSLLDTAYETGLSGTSRLHDLFVNIEGMTPGEYKNGGQSLVINYSFSPTPFGEILVASTTKGICQMTFVEDQLQAFDNLIASFPNAVFLQNTDLFQQEAVSIFNNDWQALDQSKSKIQLHLKGTAFQLKIWQTLLKIPMGDLSTYGCIAKSIDNPKASRAVGTAISKNPVAFLIPCHRVIQGTGHLGGYRWGNTRKLAIVGWEGAKLSGTKSG